MIVGFGFSVGVVINHLLTDYLWILCDRVSFNCLFTLMDSKQGLSGKLAINR